MDGMVDGYLAAKATTNTKPAGAKKAAKKAAGIEKEGSQEEEEEEEEGSSDEEEEESTVAKAPCKAKAEAKTKAAAKKAAAKTVVAEAPPATIKRPAAVDKRLPRSFHASIGRRRCISEVGGCTRPLAIWSVYTLEEVTEQTSGLVSPTRHRSM